MKCYSGPTVKQVSMPVITCKNIFKYFVLSIDISPETYFIFPFKISFKYFKFYSSPRKPNTLFPDLSSTK